MIADLILILLLGLFAFFGWRRGLIGTIGQIALTLVSLLFAFLLAPALASELAKSPGIIGAAVKLAEPVLIRMQQSVATIGELVDRFAMPPVLNLILRDAAGNPQNPVETARNTLVTAVARYVILAVVFLLVFLIFRLLVRWLFSLINQGTNRVPVIGTLNRLAGLFAGLVYGLLIISALLLVIGIAAPVLPSIVGGIERSTLTRLIYTSNPILLAFALIPGSAFEPPPGSGS